MKVLVSLACMVIVAAGIKLASGIVVPILFGVLIAVAAEPIGRWITERRALPAAIGVFASILAVLATVGGFVALLSLGGNELVTSLPSLQAAILDRRDEVIELLRRNGLSQMARIVGEADIWPRVAELLAATIGRTAELVGAILLMLLVAIFILLEGPTFGPKLQRTFGDRPLVHLRIRSAVAEVQYYLVVKTAVSVLTGLLLGTWTALIGLDGAVLWGLLAFALNYIPYVGSLLAAVPAVLVAVVQLGFLPALLVALGYLAVNLVLGELLEPRILGRALGISPLVVILSMVLWAFLLGPIGALVAVPLTMIVQIGCGHSERFRWVAQLLAFGPRRR